MDDAMEAEAEGFAESAPAGSSMSAAAESLDSVAALIDALADERGQPRAEIIRAMIADLEDRIALDRGVILLLRRLERSAAGDAGSSP